MPENFRPPAKTQAQTAIVRAQEKALHKLHQAHLPVQQSLLASQRIASLCLESVELLNEAYFELEEYVSRGGRSEDHQRWLEDRAANLLRHLELGIDASVQTAIRQIGNELTSPKPVTPQVIVQPTPAWCKQRMVPLGFWIFWIGLGVITIAVALSC